MGSANKQTESDINFDTYSFADSIKPSYFMFFLVLRQFNVSKGDDECPAKTCALTFYMLNRSMILYIAEEEIRQSLPIFL